MAVTVAHLQAVLSAKTADFDRAMDTSEGKMAKFGKVARIAGLAAAGGIVFGAGKAISAASNLGEQINKTGVVFGDNADEVHKWSKGLTRNFGMSQRAALEAAGTYANMLKPMGVLPKKTKEISTRMVELAGDMASFNNASPAETLDALRAGLAGETEPLRRFGVFLSEATIKAEALASGLVKPVKEMGKIKYEQAKLNDAMKEAAQAFKEHGKASDEYALASAKMLMQEGKLEKAMRGKEPALTAAQKAQASYNIIVKATADAQGDFERTGDSLANQQRILRAEFENVSAAVGAKLLPAVTKILGALLNLITWMEKNWPAFKKHFDDAVASVKNAFDKIKPILDGVVTAFRGIINIIKGLKEGDWSLVWTGIKQIVTGVFTAIGELIHGAWVTFKTLMVELGERMIAGIKAGLTGIGAAAWDVINNVGQWISDKADTIKGWGSSAGNWVKNAVVNALRDLGDMVWNAVKDGLKDLKGKIIGFFGDLGGSIKGALEGALGKVGVGDAFDPSALFPTSHPESGINLMGASPVMAPFAEAAAGFGLRVSSGLRPGAITRSGKLSDHAVGKALDLVGSAAAMAAFFRTLIGNRFVKQAFYDPLGSIFGGAWSSYREGGHSDHVHVATYDDAMRRARALMPGWNLAYNGTGRPEPVGMAAGGPQTIIVQLGDTTLATLVRNAKGKFEKRNGPGSF